MNTTRIKEEVEISHFKEMINRYKSNIIINPHALDHLSDSQRKLFNEHDLINPLLIENPCGVGLQKNGRYASFYRRNWGYLRIILNMTGSKLEIITFINTENIPNLKRLKDENER
ncbi:MAG: hypothetical protein NT001_02005 [Candidatus Woesearchaeota archaeon]|nr:hypothetical protein [Candidatus Woesearchaeota archaeon]